MFQLPLFTVELEPTGYIPRKGFTRLYPVRFFAFNTWNTFDAAYMTMKTFTRDWSGYNA